jgi:hypothetical protein
MSAILRFKVSAYTKLANSIYNALNGFLDPEHMGLDTNIKYIYASHTEIWARHNLIGWHFKIQDVRLYESSQAAIFD